MVDTVTPAVRSRMMAGIKGRDTKPEMILRRGLHGKGFRFRLHTRHLQGKPDLVFPKYRAVIFVHGCFWHGHDCSIFKWPSTRFEFWRAKIMGNKERDERAENVLRSSGWRMGIVWECALKSKQRHPPNEVLNRVENWLRSTEVRLELEGENKLEK
jgi:DNA mismatch endonuclease, patch repair protein